METNSKITSFTQLNAWKSGHTLVLSIYKIVSKFPKEEMYAISDQMRRCAVSITSNIAEGFSRKSRKEKVQFYYTAKGSLTELQNQLIIARDLSYISKEEFNSIASQTVIVHKLINGIIKSAQNK